MTCRFGAYWSHGQAEAADTRERQPTETVVNSTQIRALSSAELDHASVAYTATRVRIIVADHLSVALKDISDSSSFTEDLGANSLDSVEILLAIEAEFDCEFSNEAIDTIHTVGDATQYLIECNHRRTAEATLTNSAENYWLKPVKLHECCETGPRASLMKPHLWLAASRPFDTNRA
jgi:acyl carrier protein